jgi:hypothetical protein
MSQVQFLLTGALLFVAGNAWNDFMTTTITTIFPNNKGATIFAKLLYASIVTAIAVFGIKVVNDFFNTQFVKQQKSQENFFKNLQKYDEDNLKLSNK